jgi:hypothetical protein
MLSPDLVKEIPTPALSSLATTTEAVAVLFENLDDYENVIIQVESAVHTALHVIDAELQQRQSSAAL